MNSQRSLRIGVDVGGTNTDAAVLEGADVLATAKSPTTPDVHSGMVGAITAAMKQAGVKPDDVGAVMIGTTYFINALTTRRGLAKVSLLRLCSGATLELPPFVDLPGNIAQNIVAHSAFLPGGMLFNGNPILEVDKTMVEKEVTNAIAAGARGIVICAVFAPVSAKHEEQACDIAEQMLRALGRTDIIVTKSSDVASGFGILERENAAVLNSALCPLARHVIPALGHALKGAGLVNANLYMTQNDGTIMPCCEAMKLPIRCVQCGPVNSMRGAAMLAKVDDGMIIDVGGTTTDVGLISKGFPRPSSRDAFIAGVRTNFPVPDVGSLGLGGGSHIVCNGQGAPVVGPASVGAEICKLSLACGGSICTATDVAVALNKGPDDFGCTEIIKEKLPQKLLEDSWQQIQGILAAAVDQHKVSSDDVPLIVVGGGAFLVENSMTGVSEVIRPQHGGSANAVGAAAAQVSGNAVCVLQFENSVREVLLKQVEDRAKEDALAAGADPNTLQTIEIEEVPLAYVPGHTSRVRVRVIGDLAMHVGQENYEFCACAEGLPFESLHSTEVGTAQLGNIESKAQTRSDVDLVLSKGEWTVLPADVDALEVGLGVLGTGGGGSPHPAKLALCAAMQSMTGPTVVSPEDVPDDAVIATFGYMGAPTVSLEMLTSGQAGKAVRSLLSTLGKNATHVMAGEIGGNNGMIPMVVALELGLPVIDGDLMGRAFPQLNHTTAAIYGIPSVPASLADHNGNVVIVSEAASALWLENMLRPVCEIMGCCAGIALRPLTGAEMKQVCVKGTVSQAYRIGCSILSARVDHADPVMAAISCSSGAVIFSGKVVDVERHTTGGFARGEAHICNTHGKKMKVKFQNEYLIAEIDGGVVATTPELISMLETDSGRPIQTEELRYGLLVSVAVLPAPELLTTPTALAVVGPRGFGYDLDFSPFASA